MPKKSASEEQTGSENFYQTNVLVKALKDIIKRRKLRYEDIAKGIGLSVPTIKRSMASGNMSIDRFMRVCLFAGLSFKDIALVLESEAGKLFQLNEEQEIFFAKHPCFLAYFFELKKAGKTPLQIEKEHKISRNSTERYLLKLEQLNLIKRRENLEASINVTEKGFSWDDKGAFGKFYSKHFVTELSKRVSKQGEFSKDLFLQTGGLYLSDDQYENFKLEFRKLVEQNAVYSGVNQACGIKEARKISFALVADDWVDPLLRTVCDL